ncbi:MAG: energy-coupling factor transporter transmembrane component T [Actinomycetia bacterium]|nr:energy-coupling factor transporter transmembrane component T [Actinomycetes bacterium]
MAPAGGPVTALDRANPVSRVGAAVILSVPLLVTLDPVSGATALTLVLLAALGLGFRPGYIARRVAPVLALAPLGAVSMALYGKPGGTVWFDWLLIHITDSSLRLALAVLLRVLALGVPSLLLLSGIDPTDMADGLAQVWRLPARFVLGALAGFRLLGRFSDDWRSLALARRARGLGDTGAVRRFATMAFAMLVIALRRGSMLATAMEARGFGGSQRTWARPSTVGRADLVLLLAATAIVSAALAAAWVSGSFWAVWS